MSIIRRTSAVVAALALGAGLSACTQASGEPVRATSKAATPEELISVQASADSGGAGFAPSSLTRIGFEPTCAGAVTATASYATGPTTHPGGPKAAEALARWVAPGETPGAIAYRRNVAAAARSNVIVVDDATSGAFRITACTPQQSARVEIFYSESIRKDGTESNEYRTVIYDLIWSQSGNDWKVSGWNPVRIGPVLAWPQMDPWPRKLSKKQLNNLVMQAGDGWTAFTSSGT